METSKLWRTAQVFTQAPAFGEGCEVLQNNIVTVRPGENQIEACIREGYMPATTRLAIIN